MKKEYLNELKPYNPNQIDASIVLSANESTNYLFEDGVSFEKDTSKYPEANGDSLRLKLAEKWNLEKENFILGNGSTELLELVVKTYVNESENIVSFAPSFSMYDIYSKIYNANLLKVQIESDGTMNVDTLIKVANDSNAKLIFLCTPNNPTGGILSKEEVLKVLTNTKSILVVDEAYMDFSYDSETVISLVNNYDNLIVARTFSKAYGLAAFRLGYIVSNKSVIDDLLSLKLPYNVNQATIEVGKKALSYNKEVTDFIDSTIKRRDEFIAKLTTLPINVYPSKGNFVFVESDIDLYQVLLQNDILIRSFQDGTYRITIGTKSQMDMIYNILKEELL